MGNQAYNHQYAQKHNWITPQTNSLNSQTQIPLQTAKIEVPKMAEKTNFPSQLKTKQAPTSQKTLVSRLGSQIQNPETTFRNSAVTYSSQLYKNQKQHDMIRGSTLGPQSQTFLQKELPQIKILIKPQYGKSGSILQKNPTKQSNNFRMDTLIEQIDDIRVSLRHHQSKMLDNLLPAFEEDIRSMNDVIQGQRQMKLKNKNRVLYLLKQKKHYHKLCLKFKDLDQKIKAILLEFRKKDSIQQISQQQIMSGLQLKNSVETMIQSIQKDLPKKGWKEAVDKPASNYYINVVTSAIQDHEIMSQYNQLQQSLMNPQVLQQIVNQQMMHSTTRRIGGQTTEQTAKKLIEGPAHYQNSSKMMKGTKYVNK